MPRTRFDRKKSPKGGSSHRAQKRRKDEADKAKRKEQRETRKNGILNGGL